MKGKTVLVLAVLLLFIVAAPALAGNESGQVPGAPVDADPTGRISQEAERSAAQTQAVEAQQPPVDVPGDLLPEDLLDLLPGDLLPDDVLPGDLLPEDLLPGDLLPPPGGGGGAGGGGGGRGVDLGPGRSGVVAGEFLGRGAGGGTGATGAGGGRLPLTGSGAVLMALAVVGLALVSGGLGLVALRR